MGTHGAGESDRQASSLGQHSTRQKARQGFGNVTGNPKPCLAAQSTGSGEAREAGSDAEQAKGAEVVAEALTHCHTPPTAAAAWKELQYKPAPSIHMPRTSDGMAARAWLLCNPMT